MLSTVTDMNKVEDVPNVIGVLFSHLKEFTKMFIVQDIFYDVFSIHLQVLVSLENLEDLLNKVLILEINADVLQDIKL
jgi:hypothetical protein